MEDKKTMKKPEPKINWDNVEGNIVIQHVEHEHVVIKLKTYKGSMRKWAALKGIDLGKYKLV